MLRKTFIYLASASLALTFAYSQESDSTRISNEIERINDIILTNDLARSGALIDSLLLTLDKQETPVFYGKSMFVKATIVLRSQQLDQAEAMRSSVEKELESLVPKPNEIFGWYNMLKGEILFYRRDINNSFDAFQKAVDEFALHETIESYRMQGRCNNFMGVLMLMSNNVDQGAEFLNESIRQFRKVAGTEGTIAGAQSNLATIYMQQGKYQKAIESFKSVMEIRKTLIGEHDQGLFVIYTNLSSIYFQLSRLNLALEYQEKAFRFSEKYDIPSPERIQQRHRNLAKVLIEMEQDSLAEYHLNKAQEGLNRFPGDYPFLQAEIYQSRGFLLENQGKKEKSPEKSYESIRYLKLAVENYKKALGKEDLNQLYAVMGIIYNYMNLGDYDQARATMVDALALLNRVAGENEPRETELYQLMAQSYLDEDRFEEALKASKQSLEANIGYSMDDDRTFTNVQSKYRLLLSLLTMANSHYGLFFTTRELSHHEEAMRFYGLSNALIVELNENEAYEDQLITLNNLSQGFEKMASLEYELFQENQDLSILERAFNMAHTSNDIILKQALSQSREKTYGTVPDQLLFLEQSLKEDIAYLKGALYNLTELSEAQGIDSAKVNYYNDQLFDKNRSLDSLKASFKKEYPSYFNFRYTTKEITLEKLRQDLDSESQVIQFLTSPQEIFVFSIDKTKADFLKLEKPDNYEKLLNEYLLMLKDPSSDINALRELGQELYTLILEPLGGLKKNLIIIPDKELNRLPFETLPIANETTSNNGFLIDIHSVNYANSSSFLDDRKVAKRAGSIELLALASTYSGNVSTDVTDTLRAGLGRLQWTVEEAKALINAYDGEAYLEEEATETNFKKYAPGNSILHIASHGVVDNKRPLYSRLILEKDPTDSINDGNLYVHELYNMTLDAPMVVLSACNTASGELANGEGLLNIGRGFFYAGVPSVVMSHWQVDDQSTSVLMTYFYEALAQGMTKSDALRSAKLRFIEEASPNKKHPFYWGAFISMGDDSPIVRKGHGMLTILLASLAVLIVLIMLFRRRKTGTN